MNTRSYDYSYRWSKFVGPYANELAPRAGAPWTAVEDQDLLNTAARRPDLSVLASAHGRSELAIAYRLEKLGYDRGTLGTMDFSDLERRRLLAAKVVYSTTEQQEAKEMKMKVTDSTSMQQGAKSMNMTASRLITLLTVSRGIDVHEADRPLFNRNVATLVANGLVTVIGIGCPPTMTDKGLALVELLLSHSSMSSETASTTWNSKRGTSTLGNQRFFLVASGDAMKVGTFGDIQLKKPPVSVKLSYLDAEHEASRLAGQSCGEKFFVLQAMSVHEAKQAPTKSRRL